MNLLSTLVVLLMGQQDPWMKDGAAARQKALKEQKPCVLILDAEHNAS